MMSLLVIFHDIFHFYITPTSTVIPSPTVTPTNSSGFRMYMLL